ncbi:hypothetical protein IV203_036849 [Nitzschia inconspicua]|uniref:Uncharacterized protein n=1 Tax=Nitzschia inconspicua TaxID=303405 RepID=A0A9K3LGU0_9STRA|nr:hypothetical protein IV203_036849 [Nitzschia inconspicua]
MDESGSAFFSVPFMAITKAQFEAASFSSCFEQGEWDPGLYGQYKRKLDEAEETATSLAMLDHGLSLTRQLATRGLSPFSPPSAKYRKTCLKADGRVAASVSEKREVTKERSQATSTQAGGITKEELFFHCQLAAHRGWQQCQSDLREKEITFTNVNNRIEQLSKAIMDTKDYFPSDWFLHPEDHMDNVLFRRTCVAMKKRFDALDHQKKLLLKHEKQVEAKMAARKAGIMDEGNIFNTFIDRTLEPIMAPVLGRGRKRLLPNHEKQVEAAKYRKTAARVSEQREVTLLWRQN